MAKGTRILTGRDGQRYRFDPGSLILELLLSGGTTPYGIFIEDMAGPADLAAWLAESRLAITVPLSEEDFRITPRELAAVKNLRDTMWHIVPALAHGEALRPADLAVLNACAGPTPRPRVDVESRAPGWATPITGTQVLGALAREAIDLVATDLAGRVHECSADDCKLLFLDTSRSNNRRWCSMERCGNRNKVRSYRARTG
jgi:predicted RNA-binding Zn ribbon-like protein